MLSILAQGLVILAVAIIAWWLFTDDDNPEQEGHEWPTKHNS